MAKTTGPAARGKAKAKATSKRTAKSTATPKAKAKAKAKPKTAVKPKPKTKPKPKVKTAAKKKPAPKKAAAATTGGGVPAAVTATLANARQQLAALNDTPPSTDQDSAIVSPAVPVSPPVRAEMPVRAAFERMPEAFWPTINILCDRPEAVREAYRQGHAGPGSLKAMLGVIVAAGGAYGAIMGATNTLQGAGGLAAMIPVTAIKVPLLLLVSFAIAFPLLYLAARFLSYSFTSGQAAKLLLASSAVTAATLGGTIPIAALFAITGAAYSAMQQLHALLLLIALFMGALFFTTRCHAILGRHATIRPLTLITIYFVLHVLITVQWISVTGPYIGSPGAPFAVFRP